MDTHTELGIAETILAQLGGRTFLVMTGAKALASHPEGALSFKLPGHGFAKDGINYVKVTLNGRDLYDLSFLRVRGTSVKVVHTEHDIYADALKDLFWRVTGLALAPLVRARRRTAELRGFNNRHED